MIPDIDTRVTLRSMAVCCRAIWLDYRDAQRTRQQQARHPAPHTVPTVGHGGRWIDVASIVVEVCILTALVLLLLNGDWR